MKLYRIFLGAAVALLLPVCIAAQTLATIEQSPVELNDIPRGATDDNPYWQHLIITLTQDPTGGDEITLNLPSGIAIVDVDSSGSFADDVMVESGPDANTGYGIADATSDSRILLTSSGGSAGEVHVQFPLATQIHPAVSSVFYGTIDFSNGAESDIRVGALKLNYVWPNQLAIVNFTRLFADGFVTPDSAVVDTFTNAQGDVFPTTIMPATLPLPDLKGISSRDDVTYFFWFSGSDSLGHIDNFTAVPALDQVTGRQAQVNEESMAPFPFVVSNLSETIQYLYVTSNLTGNFPLARSRGIQIYHKPVVVSVGSFMSDNSDYLDSGRYLNFDSGVIFDPDEHPAGAGPTDEVEIFFEVVDFNDNAEIRLFYSEAASLDTSDLVGIEALAGAIPLFQDPFKENSESRYTWKIGPDQPLIPVGNYYIYAAATDGKASALGRSEFTYNVRHSPFLEISSVDGFNTSGDTLNTGGLNPGRYLTIRWNGDDVNGDIARSDSDAGIDLYYSAKEDFAIPGTGEDLVRAAADPTLDPLDTHLLAGGLAEAPDGREDNQFAWDLWSYTNPDDGGVPAADSTYYIYAIIHAGEIDRLVRWDGSVFFRHDPYLRVTGPLPNDQDNLRVSWESRDIDEAAAIWIVLTAEGASEALGDSITYGDITADGSTDWIATSADGSVANGRPLSEDDVTEFGMTPSFLLVDSGGGSNPIVDGSYRAYVVIDTSGGDEPVASSRAFRAPGPTSLSGLDAARVAGVDSSSVVEVVPGRFTIGAMDSITLEIRPSAFKRIGLVDTVDLVSVAMSIDTTFFDVVDQDTGSPGIQPFAINPFFFGQNLSDTLNTQRGEKDTLNLVYYDQIGTTLLNGAVTLATLQLVAKDTIATNPAGITTDIVIKNFPGNPTALYNKKDTVSVLPDSILIEATIKSRSTISGRVPLQGRDHDSTWVTFFLRDYNSLEPIADSLFIAANDSNFQRPGIQRLSTDSTGSYTLRKVPSGVFRLTAHVESYLDGQYPTLIVNLGNNCSGVDSLGVNIIPLDNCSGVNPTFLREGLLDVKELLGGDVAGYVDTSGRNIPDNEIDSQDIDFVVDQFGEKFEAVDMFINPGLRPSEGGILDKNSGLLADVDGDSLVWVLDLHIVTANFGTRGKEPVYKPVVINGSDPVFRLDFEEMEDGRELEVEVAVEGLRDVRAYGFRLRYDRAVAELKEFANEELFGDRMATYATRHEDDELAVGGALIGAQPGVSGSGRMARLRFEVNPGFSLQDVQLSLADLEVVDSAHRQLEPRVVGMLPVSYRLMSNFPNPFNAQTMVQFSLPKEGRVRLEIYDVIGQLVRSLADDSFRAGVHRLTWDGMDRQGRGVASGIYLLRMRSGEFVAMQKMLLLR